MKEQNHTDNSTEIEELDTKQDTFVMFKNLRETMVKMENVRAAVRKTIIAIITANIH